MKYTIDDIENYLNHSLSAEERIAFEKELEINPNLKTEVELFEVSNFLIASNEDFNVRSSINAAKASVVKKQKIKLIAVSSTILLCTGVLTYWAFHSTKNEESALPINNNVELSYSKPTKESEVPNENTSETKVAYATPIESKIKENIQIQDQVETQPSNISGQIESKTSTPTEISQKSTPIEKVKTKEVVEKNTAPPMPLPTKNKCENVKITSQILLKDACYNVDKPQIENIISRGGNSPYNYQLVKNNVTKDFYSELENGKYTLQISDANGCRTDTSFTVQVKNCNLTFDFNPSFNEIWNALSALENGKITIIHGLSQQLIYEQELTSGDEITWDGKTMDGKISDGFHIFVIEYDNNTVVKGKITVTN